MKTVLSGMICIFSVFLCGTVLITFLVLAAEKENARIFFDSAVHAVEESYGHPAVMADCARQAEAAGYRLETKEIAAYKESRLWEIRLIYPIRLPFADLLRKTEGSLIGYAG